MPCPVAYQLLGRSGFYIKISVTMLLSAGMIFSPRSYSFTTKCISSFLESIQHPEHSWFTYQVADTESFCIPQQGRMREMGLQVHKDGKSLRRVFLKRSLSSFFCYCKFANFNLLFRISQQCFKWVKASGLYINDVLSTSSLFVVAIAICCHGNIFVLRLVKYG